MKRKEQLKDLPYTVIGGTSLPMPKKTICFTGKGIKAIAKQVSDNDTVVYEDWDDYNDECKKVKHYARWSVIRHSTKER